MRLVAFRVKNCFGFRDSGVVNLDDPTNLIYLLGKNSSGKTSLLTALSAMSSSQAPSQFPTFQNFDPTEDTSYICAKFTVKPGEITQQGILDRVTQAQESLSRGDSTLFNSSEYVNVKAGMYTLAVGILSELVSEIEHQGEVWVVRLADGTYQIVVEGASNDSRKRARQFDDGLATILRTLHPQNTTSQMFVGGSMRGVTLLSGTQFEALVFGMFPQTAWFKDSYTLLDALPDAITIEHIDVSPNQLTTALISYLGKDELRRLLTVKNPDERRRLEEAVRAKMNELVTHANHRGTHQEDVFGVDLDRSDGLQITMMTGGKPSFYRHISDTTKLLFAYHLFSRVHDLAGRVLLFDEPSNGFHASAQAMLLAFFQSLGRDGTLIILSNHSEHLIDPDYLGGVRLMGADKDGYLHVSNHYYQPVGGEGDSLALRPIADAIGLKYGAIQLAHSDKIVITEGVTDMLYLQTLRVIFGYERRLPIAPAIGEHEIPHIAAILIAQGIAFKLAIDTSTGGSTVKSKVQKAYGVDDEYIHEVPIPASSASKTGSGVEDLFSKADFRRVLEQVGETVPPEFDSMSNSEYMSKSARLSKRIVADWFAKHAVEFSERDFDDETRSLVRDTLNFCVTDNWFQFEP